MAVAKRLICPSAALAERGRAVRFTALVDGLDLPAFAIRVDGKPRAYFNACPHLGTELDWRPGEVFDEGRTFLICATHGALFRPHDGYCESGPCRGDALSAIGVVEDHAGVHAMLPAVDAPSGR